MFIQTEETPNPQVLKFIPGQPVLEQGTAEFKSPEEAKSSPLARRLFQISGLTSVFLSKDFISISKNASKEWFLLKPAILGAIMEHFTSGAPIITEAQSSPHDYSGEDSDVTRQIKELLDIKVRPAVAMDGGDIVFHKFEDGVVYLTMQGACAGCPSSNVTLKMGIENMLRHYIPEVEAVEAVY